MLPGVYKLADNLEGLTLGTWFVEKKASHKPSSGGNFSVGYEAVSTSGRQGFLKALDYSSAFSSPSPADVLNNMTNAYIFERDLLNKCSSNRLRYVVKIIDSGTFSLSTEKYPEGISFSPPVDYIVLEKADDSMRNLIDISKIFDYSWALRSLHNIAVAIEEMHSIQIAHQDIKPSNVLLFNQQNISKLGDVGRSSSRETHATHDNYDYAGDPVYSPFEQLYGYVDSEWTIRRYSCDMFMFGNLIMTYFNNISVTMAVLNKLPPECWPKNWGDSYTAIMPQIQNAFSECLENFNHSIEPKLRQELITMVQQLCCPEVSKRGDMKNAHLGTQQYSLRRYISKLDVLARTYEHQLKKVVL